MTIGLSPGSTDFCAGQSPGCEVDLESKDVIHDFFIPNFRAQLYRVPGMRGRLIFTPTITTRELEQSVEENRRHRSIDHVAFRSGQRDLSIDIDSSSPGAQQDKTGWRYVDSAKKKKPATIIRDGMAFAPGVAAES